MAENILEKIIKKKEKTLKEIKKNISMGTISKMIQENKSYLNFKEKINDNINKNKISIIAEIKKASPSAGIIVEKYNPVDIAKIYLKNIHQIE